MPRGIGDGESRAFGAGLNLAVRSRRKAAPTGPEAALSGAQLLQRGAEAVATAAELQTHAARAQRDYARMRRLALPRNMLSRLVELAVVLDRAALLEERGHYVRLGEFVEPSVTPRNAVLFASRQFERLPRVLGRLER